MSRVLFTVSTSVTAVIHVCVFFITIFISIVIITIIDRVGAVFRVASVEASGTDVAAGYCWEAPETSA